MFSALGNIFNYFFNQEDTEDDNTETRTDEVQSKWPDSSFIIEEQEIEAFETRRFDGKVTHVFGEHGLVDGEIYFALDDSQGSHKPGVGDAVSVVAKQQYENGGWYAEEITVVSKSWEDEEEEAEAEPKSACVGKITQLGNETGMINGELEFEIDSCVENFKPWRGDWVTAELEAVKVSEDEDRVWAVNVEPLRQWTFVGDVSAAMEDHGYVDGEVYFTPKVCVNNYRPRKRDRVKVTAIESHQGKCSWRATQVVPCSSDDGGRSNPHKVNQYKAAGSGEWVIPGQRPQRFQNKMKLPQKLPSFVVPERLRQCVWCDGELTELVPELAQVLTMDNYVKKFSALLHLEEIQQEIDIRQFDLHRVCLRRCGEYLALQVPGLAEGRPSILIGDKIILTDPGDPDGPCYEGFVHEIHSSEVLLKFNPEFQGKYNGEDYNVEFTFNRTSLRRCHQAVSLAVRHLKDTVLFPTYLQTKMPQIQLSKPSGAQDVVKLQASYTGFGGTTQNNGNCHPQNKNSVDKEGTDRNGKSTYLPNINPWTQDQVKFFNRSLNNRQKAAVIKILLGQSRPLPYVIFGPPGTGKTMTMVEAILQVFSQIPSSRIIASTPSNSAADLLAERLVASGLVKESDLVRLNAFNRSLENVPEVLEKYCRYGDDLELISRYRVVVCTCNSAGSLYMLGLKAGHFTHAFVDEAGQATEPECLISTGLVAGADGQIVLAGDPKQLGPVIMSKFSKMYGLEFSFLERLMERSLYMRNERLFADHGGFDSMLVTMLVENYRSHPAILALPSRLFYFDQLEVVSDPALTHTLCDWDMLPRKNHPVIFHGLRGEDMRETDSPSWFNPMETVQVVHYLQSLLNNRKYRLTVDDIGIITPYRKQVEKIRLMIDKLDVDMVKVGSVEEFQGQERKAIIISTVRANEKLIGFDLRHTLGFLSNAKRFNVSITRAQALLIIVGNPHVLCQDDKWRSLIRHCVDNGAYVGCELPDFTQYGEDGKEDGHEQSEADGTSDQGGDNS
ncbi:RNA helicase Mov10l1-like [Haliotis rubra]|uniref:RNA helicase Mov10l1-like n=1 Tax=Haliotis rubra TaxID=36100 RepID=UPI001EE540F0|nr:RNA helicase Mov10l1-like [Haliotis rubra]XP_046583748.1 RNA helicase Mov10l1-like [Haliotis rubra]XP_046583750.1 RNA helicase Mov10l1-like [Haliotis rubra]